MNAVPNNPLVNLARDCMTRLGDQKEVRNAEPMFVRQLDLIEPKDDDAILEAIKRKAQADENRHQWIRDEIVSPGELDEYEEKLKELHRLHSQYEDDDFQTEEDKKKFGRKTLKNCELDALKTTISTLVPYTGYGSGMLHALADSLAIGWHPEWKQRLCDAESEVDDGE